MYKLIISLILSLAVFQLGSSASALEFPGLESKPVDVLGVLQVDKQKQKPNPQPRSEVYFARSGDSLSKIAQKNKTTVQRLYDANLKIKDPDQIKVGQKITIPDPKQKLKHRSLHRSLHSTTQPVDIDKRPVVAGNTYGYGYCTWYVKNRRPDLPNGLGNADTWDDRAPGYGFKVGTHPRVGAAGVTKAYMHVVYIERVKGDQVLVSEMNYAGWNVVSQRWAPASEFNYIY